MSEAAEMEEVLVNLRLRMIEPGSVESQLLGLSAAPSVGIFVDPVKSAETGNLSIAVVSSGLAEGPPELAEFLKVVLETVQATVDA